MSDLRKENVVKLLNEVNETILHLKKVEQEAITDTKISELESIKVGYSLLNLRKCLDYLVQDIYDEVYRPTDGLLLSERKILRMYFPYVNDSKKFDSFLPKPIKDLKRRNKKIYDWLKSVQPFTTQKN